MPAAWRLRKIPELGPLFGMARARLCRRDDVSAGPGDGLNPQNSMPGVRSLIVCAPELQHRTAVLHESEPGSGIAKTHREGGFHVTHGRRLS